MKSFSLLPKLIAAAFLLLSGTAAQAATSSAMIALYRVSGITNFGTTNSGVATSFHCTNWNSVAEAIQIFVRNDSAVVVAASAKITVAANTTYTGSTHQTNLFFDGSAGQDLGAANVSQGSALILGTSKQISCTAMIVDAAAANPVGIALHMIRFNALPGSQE